MRRLPASGGRTERTSATRRGFTLVELIVGLLLASLVGAAAWTVLERQLRFHADATLLLGQRAQLRQGASMLPVELRAISPSAGDLLAATDSMMELRATVAAGVACAVEASGSVSLPVASGDPRMLASVLSRPRPGDAVLLLDGGAQLGTSGDAWVERALSAAVDDPAACAGSPLAPGAGGTTLRLVLAGDSLPVGVRQGSFVRVLRRTRWALHHSSDSRWYLSVAEWTGAGYAAPQPAAGPYRRWSAPGTGASGLELRYLDASGDVAALPERVASVAVAFRARTPRPASLGGRRRVVDDSLALVVSPRNRE